jgi:5-dehydro-2-deoxygluconokinase
MQEEQQDHRHHMHGERRKNHRMETRTLDFVAIGRAAVDFYGEQVGGRLEDMTTFAKYIGGSPTNTAIGAARLGLRTAVLSRVGDEHMGRFVRETLEREGVDVSHLRTDPERLTALVVLGIRDRDTFPLIFFRENCADMGIDEDDIDAAFIASAKSVVTSGTHFSTERVDRASRLAIRFAREAGSRVVLDIDYRPVLWGLAGKGLGENRFVADDTVSAHLQSIVPDCDLVVGTEEEIHIAGGTTDTLEALRRLRGVSDATLVLKRGAMGCTAFPGEIPKVLDDGVGGRRFEIEVYNVLGAGDAFMGGFLRGWLPGESLETCCTYANACGAMVVSRHACSPESPSWIELVDYLEKGSPHFRLREDTRLAHIHRATNRPSQWPEVRALAFDHRSQLEVIADDHDVDRRRIGAFKELVGHALERADDGTPGLGALVDGTYGDTVLARLTGTGRWVARPVEEPGSVPLRFEGGPNVGLALREWPAEQVVKCLVFFHPDDGEALRRVQTARLVTLNQACRTTSHDLLVEIIVPAEPEAGPTAIARVIEEIYAAGVKPDWWKLQPAADAEGWRAISDAIAREDPLCRGIVLLGQDVALEDLGAAFRLARRFPLCKGFAVGRSIFRAAAEAWFAGKMDDAGVIDEVAANYRRVVELWRSSAPS